MEPRPQSDNGPAEPALAPDRTAAPPAGPERDLWAGRTHWQHYAGGIAIWLVAAVVLAVLVLSIDALSGKVAAYLVGIPVIGSALVLGARLVVRIYGSRYRVTDERLFFERGVLSQTIDQTELIRVDDVRVRKNLVDRLFGLGSVEVLSTDVSDRAVVIPGIRKADEVTEIIRTRMRTLRGKSLFIEHL